MQRTVQKLVDRVTYHLCELDCGHAVPVMKAAAEFGTLVHCPYCDVEHAEHEFQVALNALHALSLAVDQFSSPGFVISPRHSSAYLNAQDLLVAWRKT